MKRKLRTKITGGLLLTFVLVAALVGFCIYTIAYVNNALRYRYAGDLEIEGLYTFMDLAGIIVIFMAGAVLLSFFVLGFVIVKNILKPVYGTGRSARALARKNFTVEIIKTESEDGENMNELKSVHDDLNKNIDDMQNASRQVSEGVGNVLAASKELGILLESLENAESLSVSSCQSKAYKGKAQAQNH